MQPSNASAVILKVFKEKNNWIRASKLLEDLDHSISRSSGNIAKSMSILDKSNQISFGYRE
jgi:hypothetical protein